MGGPKAPHGRFIPKSERAMAMTVSKGFLLFQIKCIQVISAPPNNKKFIQIINTRILGTEKFSSYLQYGNPPWPNLCPQSSEPASFLLRVHRTKFRDGDRRRDRWMLFLLPAHALDPTDSTQAPAPMPIRSSATRTLFTNASDTEPHNHAPSNPLTTPPRSGGRRRSVGVGNG